MIWNVVLTLLICIEESFMKATPPSFSWNRHCSEYFNSNILTEEEWNDHDDENDITFKRKSAKKKGHQN